MKHALPVPLTLALLLVSCGEHDKQTESHGDGIHKPVIAAVNYPLAYFAERLSSDFATVLYDVPTNQDPAFWEPGDEQITAIQEADLILLNGATYAKWISTRTLPDEITVTTSSSFRDKLIAIEGTLKHTHKKGEEAHSHNGLAFTTWLDFKQASAQASEIASALAERFPERKETVMTRLAPLLEDLNNLDIEMAAATSGLGNAPVIVSHPVYQYWARAYRITAPSLLWEPDMELTPGDLAALATIREENPGTTLFIWEGNPLPQNTEKLKRIGLTSVVISPCGKRPVSGDFLSVMRANVAALRALSN
ncbi:MAG: zinc ABC transporter substrate-binding protein [Roseibacillus sp.]|nr:zinc ABC transporter substrate-binding protein [Roseibacillus sp.]